MQITRQFSDKLHAAFLILLLIVLALAWFSYTSLSWYETKLQQHARAVSVLRDYHRLASLARQEMSSLEERLTSSAPTATGEGRERRAQALRDTVFQLREDMSRYAAIEPTVDEQQTMQALSQMEQRVEETIAASALIHQSLDRGRQSEANAAWNRLIRVGTANVLAGLVDTAIDRQLDLVRTMDIEPGALTRRLADLLPAVMALFVVTLLALSLLFSRSLTRPLRLLKAGARKFNSGDFDHRIPQLKDKDFKTVAKAFNNLAQQVSENRRLLKETTAKLEATVEERTRALTESNRKLAEVDQTRRKLLADISHEFRTPLTVIRGESEVALRGGSKSETEYRAAIQRILDQAHHASSVVDDLMFITRADAGEPRLELAPVAVLKLMRSLCQEFEAPAMRRDITIDQRIEGPEAIIAADVKRLRQVFVVLLDNAVRYSNPGGTVEVSASRQESEVEILVRDYGIGLDEEDASRAFERFYRGRRAQQHARGTGLGLPVAKAVVEAHNGSISLKGQAGLGATATVTLPLPSQFRGRK